MTYGAGHAQIIASVAETCQARGHDITILGLTTAHGQLVNQGFEPYGFRDLLEDGDEDALALGNLMSTRVLPHANVPAGETEAYLGLSYRELIYDHGVEEAAELFSRYGRQAFLPKRTIRRAILKYRPDVIVATNSPRAEQAAIEVAREFGIPSVVIVDLLLGFDIGRLQQGGYGDRVCVLTQQVGQRLHDLGRLSEEIVVTGNPAFDAMARPGAVAEANELRQQRGWEGKKVVLWGSQPEPKDANWGLSVALGLAAIFEKHPDWQLIVRPHPNERMDVAKLPSHVQVSTQAEEVAVILQAVDLTLVVSSTLGMQSACLGTPVVQLNLQVSAEPVSYVELGIAVGAGNIADCEQAISRIFSRSKYSPNGLPEVGRSSERVAEVIESLVPQPAP